MFKRIAIVASVVLGVALHAQAAVTSTAYNQFRSSLGAGGLNLTSDTIIAIPLSASYTPTMTMAGQKMVSDVTAYEVTTCGGARLTLASKTWTESGASFIFKSTSPLVWNASGCTLNIKYIAFAKSTGADSTSPLLLLINVDNTSGSAQFTATSGGNITITMDATYGWLWI
jgi:hypothetical protein